jgi:hypothetical protein
MLRIDAYAQCRVTHPGHPGPVHAGGVPTGGGEQGQALLGAAGRGEQVRPGHHGADERVLLEREQLQRATGVGGQAAQQLVRLGQGRRVRDRPGQMIRGMAQLATLEGRPGLLEVGVGGAPGVIHGGGNLFCT